MGTKFIFISGAPNTGKSTILKTLHKFLKETKNFKEIKKEIIANNEGMFILEGYNNKEVPYLMLPNYEYMNLILENNLNIVYHINDLTKKYIYYLFCHVFVKR